jgi:methylated-DNA-[protein]-cysteine S-methyltransferase
LSLLLHSPVGLLLVDYQADAVTALRFWPQGEHPPAGTRDAPHPADRLGRQIEHELREYFVGARRGFTLPLRLHGTPFRRRVWEALRRIPCGETLSYARLAEQLGSAGAARAVGQANRHNPLPIVVPCHRVVGAGGAMGGYLGAEAGGGVAIKQWLLVHERAMVTGD